MSKKIRGKLPNYAEARGEGKECKNGCGLMERRVRTKRPKGKSYFFKEWDYCRKCGHLQHYDEFKSTDWQEDERQKSFLASI